MVEMTKTFYLQKNCSQQTNLIEISSYGDLKMKIRGKQESHLLLKFNFRIKAQKEEENWKRH